MRIAQVAPLAEAVPPKLYGGTERVVSWLTEELVRRGHEVTLFASGDSRTSARLVSLCPQSLRLSGINDHLPMHLVALQQVKRQVAEFDIVHFHLDLIQYPVFEELSSKTVTTLHGRLDISDYQPVYRAFPQMPLVSISQKQREPMPKTVRWLANIPHGLPAEGIPFSNNPHGYLAFIGRISPEKRPDRAIEIAIKAGLQLKIAAKIDHVDQRYFNSVIKPMLDHPLVEFVGEISDIDKPAFIGGAKALLFPIDWPEPFGLVMIEAMSAGTPVIAWKSGSVPEVIRHGVSGYIVDSIDRAVEAVRSIDRLDRRMVRAEFESRFTVETMADCYEKAYTALRLAGTANGRANISTSPPEDLAVA
jgi:glycosyltransferase involved in cell wall biosynthesis